MNINFYTKYENMGASSRMRSLQFFPFLSRHNIDPKNLSLISNSQLLRKYKTGSYNPVFMAFLYIKRICHIVFEKNDLIWVEKELFPWLPAWVELLILGQKKIILDFDDAIFHNYDLHANRYVRTIFGSKIDKLMARATVVTAGNSYLKKRAMRAGAKYIKVLPTVIRMSRYDHAVNVPKTSFTRIVWIGTPSTSKYLSLIAPALTVLAQENEFIFRVIGAKNIVIPGVSVEYLEWSEDTEVNLISECDIGIMPLQDNPWELGKCAYKLIQYMACGLPTVSSPIGANIDIVQENETGFFAKNSDEWIRSLQILLSDPKLRKSMGLNGLNRVKANYTVELQAEQMANLIHELGAMS